MESNFHHLTLIRSTLDNMTFGKIFHCGDFLMYTLECPWLSNKKGLSCIPPGKYSITQRDSASHEDVFSLENIDLGVSFDKDTHRDEILIHIGNYLSDIKGCIAPGLNLQLTTWGVADSGLAMDVLRDIIDEDEDWILEIIQ